MPATVAVIIEWENALLSEVDRARRMLATLDEQAKAYARGHNTRFELLVMYDPGVVDLSVPKSTVEDEIDTANWPGEVKFLESPGLHYFDQKNLGARSTTAEVIMFLDSDVVPDAGWLAHLLDSLDSPDVQVVGGQTYLDTNTLLDRLFAGFWFFPVDPRLKGLRPIGTFWANNVAFRREILEQYRFEPATAYRGQSTALARQLRRDGINIFRHGEATMSHPAPGSLEHVVARAIVHGYDNVYWARHKPHGAWLASPLGALGRFLGSFFSLFTTVPQRAKALKLGIPTATGSFFLGLLFYLIIFGSEIVAFFAPDLIRNNIQV
jgi:GT2 family glycosyltransferase